VPCPVRHPLFGPETACAGSRLNTNRTHVLGAPALAALLFGALLFAGSAHARTSPDIGLWQPVEQTSQMRASSEPWVQPKAFRTVQIQHAQLDPLLVNAPKESAQTPLSSGALISLPMPDGTQAQFRFVESPVMDPELAARFPEIKTYRGCGVDDPAATVRFDLTPAGFHAQILSPKGAAYIEPYLRGNTNLHAVYSRRDYSPSAPNFECLTAGTLAPPATPTAATPAVVSGGNLRTYRLACAATAEYVRYFGGTVPAGLAAIVTAINRVSGIYETELGIRLVLVAQNDQIIYTNAAAEPYSNGNPSALLMQNQATLDSVIGAANYDVGHVLSTAGGGMAGVGVACVAGFKAQGETGTYPPVGDAFYIDYVAHEIGHQFGASHSFNSSVNACGYGNRCAATAYEPGSGSTIMSYAGICSFDNLQSHSGPYFHSASLEQILTFTTAGSGKASATITSDGNNPPTVDAGPSYTIPMGTPFTLTTTGSEPDGESLTYCWEERDLGPSITLLTPDNGSSPLFRSFNPTASPARTFPQWSDILNHTTTRGEMLPTTSRTLNFRVTVRDSSTNGGATAASDTQVIVTTNAGPFIVTGPVAGVTWSGAQTITWDVAGTTNAPVNAACVTILLSTNGGLSFPIVLASNAPNNGLCSVLLPAIDSSAARIEVQAADNIFFAISPGNFSIVVPVNPSNYPPVLVALHDCAIHAGYVLTVTNSATDPNIPALPLSFSLDPGAPPGVTIDPASGLLSWAVPAAYANTTNTIAVRVTQTSTPGLSDAKSFAVIVAAPPVLQSFRLADGVAQLAWNTIPGQSYRLQYKPDLAATNWTDILPDITATAATASATDPVGSAPQRFYRILLLP
jgi:Metallo-peptidase family M12B Reprolysin-like